MSRCSIFKNLHKPAESRTLLSITNDIAGGRYKPQVEKIRSLLAEGKTAEAQELKKQLPSFTPSAVFHHRRVREELASYSGIIHLDFDKLSDEEMGGLRRALSSSRYTHIYFVSPGGRGMKVFVEVSSGAEEHASAYKEVQAYYENLAGLKADPSCKDITRLCFMSYDPDIYRNLENEKFPLKSLERIDERLEIRDERLEVVDSGVEIRDEELVRPLTSNPLTSNLLQNSPTCKHFEDLFQQQVQFTNRIKAYEEGSRNAYIYQLALNCKKVGMPEQDTIAFCIQHFDLPAKEMETTVKSAYKRSLESFAQPTQLSQPSLIRESQKDQKDQKDQKSQKSHLDVFAGEQEEPITRELMPTLPDSIFETMPVFLQQVTAVASTKEERDILLLTSMTTLSVALPRLAGRYNDNPVSPNLYLFISAVASAGKGIVTHCEKLVMPIHEKLREEARLLKESYDVEIINYNNNKSKDPNVQRPQKAPQKMLLNPANNSSTGFLEIFKDSDERALIFETEGDTLTNAFRSEHGNFSDSFRKAFHHERISYYRRTDKEFVEIKHPCLSVVLSGTPKQIEELIPGAENGLFSRFVFYVMNMQPEWKDVFAGRTDKGMDQHFEQLGKKFYAFYQHLQLVPEMTFTLSDGQQQQFNTFFAQLQSLYITIQNENIISSVRRLGLSAYRMMMVFSALRLMQTGEQTTLVACEDVDFNNTLQMISVLVQHSSHVFRQVGAEVKAPKPKNRKEQLLELLPQEFNRQGYLQVARRLEIPASSTHRYINQFLEAGIIYRPQHDTYLKVQVEVPKKE